MKEKLGEKWLIFVLAVAAIGLCAGFAGTVWGPELVQQIRHTFVERSVDATMGAYLTATVRALATGTPTP